MRSCLASLAALCLLTSCTFVTRNAIGVSGNAISDDAVAEVVAPALERHGLLPVWSGKTGSGPCTGARGCSWAPEGKGWLQPWVLVASPSAGQVRITIETRHDGPGEDSRVRTLAEVLAKALSERLGKDNIVIETLD